MQYRTYLCAIRSRFLTVLSVSVRVKDPVGKTLRHTALNMSRFAKPLRFCFLVAMWSVLKVQN